MKNAMKKLLSLMLVAVLLASAVPFQASASEVSDNATTTVKVTANYDGGSVTLEVDSGSTVRRTDVMTAIETATGKTLEKFRRNGGTFPLENVTADTEISVTAVFKAEHEHSYTSTVTTAATCTTAGVKTFTCSCNESYTEEIAATGHSYVSSSTATCTAAGVKTYTCTVCRNTYTEDAAATGHSFGAWVETKAPTTTEKGVNTRTCSACGATETSEIAMLTTTTDSSNVSDNTKNLLTVTLDYACDELADHYLYLDSNMKWATVFAETDNAIDTPTRENYTFAGWYWDSDYDYKVSNSEYVSTSNTAKVTIYARWTRSSGADNTYLYIYTNGKTTSAAKIVDISNYGEYDGKIEIGEALTVARKYYSFSGYNGVYDEGSWNGGNFNKTDAQTFVTVNDNGNTDVYLMIWNASTSSTSSSTTSSTTSSSTADSSNPKTGDTIYMAATVLAVSATALVAVYFFMKKRRAA